MSFVGALVTPIISLNNGLLWVLLLDYKRLSVRISEYVTRSLNPRNACLALATTHWWAIMECFRPKAILLWQVYIVAGHLRRGFANSMA